MFQNWGFLLGEIWGLLFLAAVLGLLSGWLIWSRREFDATDAASRELKELRALLAAAELRDAEGVGESPKVAAGVSRPAEASVSAEGHAEPAGRLHNAAGANDPATARPGFLAYDDFKPTTLTSPRNGSADDLKRIKGVSDHVETLLHQMGVYHFDQIAGWDKRHVDWFNARLDAANGCVKRDNWVKQAQMLREGVDSGFARRMETRDHYRN